MGLPSRSGRYRQTQRNWYRNGNGSGVVTLEMGQAQVQHPEMGMILASSLEMGQVSAYVHSPVPANSLELVPKCERVLAPSLEMGQVTVQRLVVSLRVGNCQTLDICKTIYIWENVDYCFRIGQAAVLRRIYIIISFIGNDNSPSVLRCSRSYSLLLSYSLLFQQQPKIGVAFITGALNSLTFLAARFFRQLKRAVTFIACVLCLFTFLTGRSPHRHKRVIGTTTESDHMRIQVELSGLQDEIISIISNWMPCCTVPVTTPGVEVIGCERHRMISPNVDVHD